MKNCPVCKILYKDEVEYCPNCGYPLESIQIEPDPPQKETQKKEFSNSKKISRSHLIFFSAVLGILMLFCLILIKRSPNNQLRTGSYSALEITSSPSKFSSVTSAPNETEKKDLDSSVVNAAEIISSSTEEGATVATYPGYVDLERDKTVSVDLSGNGTYDTLYYTADIKADGAKKLTLIVNDHETVFDLNNYDLMETFLGVAAADINLADEYRNILLYQSSCTIIYAYNNSEDISPIKQVGGLVDLNSLDGTGNLVYFDKGILTDLEGNTLYTKHSDSLYGKEYTPISSSTGVLLGVNQNQFVEGFSYCLYQDAAVYEDSWLTEETGIIIPSGTIIEIEEQYNRDSNRPFRWTYRIKLEGRDVWIESPVSF